MYMRHCDWPPKSLLHRVRVRCRYYHGLILASLACMIASLASMIASHSCASKSQLKAPASSGLAKRFGFVSPMSHLLTGDHMFLNERRAHLDPYCLAPHEFRLGYAWDIGSNSTLDLLWGVCLGGKLRVEHAHLMVAHAIGPKQWLICCMLDEVHERVCG